MNAPHDAGDGEGFFVVGDDEHFFAEFVFGAVEGGDCFVFFGGANDDAAVDVGLVEGVHWLAEFGHDIIGDVDDVVVSAVADGFQSLFEPIWGLFDGDVFDNEAAVAGAKFRDFDLDCEFLAVLRESDLWFVGCELAVGDDGDFAGDAFVAPKVGSVGEGFVVDFDDGVVEV